MDFETLLKEGLARNIKSLLGGKDNDELQKAGILLIYNSSKARVFQAADILRRGIIRPDSNITIFDEVSEPALPNEEIWDFQLGDTVKVRLSREDFKWMQRKTLGWRENLQEIYGLAGIVTNVSSKYDNAIGVYFPKVFASFSLYAGLLEKTEPEDDPSMLCTWKRGDYVKPIPSTKVLKLLQHGLADIDDELVTKRGRVVGVAHPCVMVTFDGKSTKDLKASSLLSCRDQSPIKASEIIHARGFQVGEQVRIISNMKKLIENQKGKGGWSPDMCPIRGETATVTEVQEDGTLGVQTKNSRPWRLSPDSVLRSEEEEPYSDEDLKILPGEIIKVLIPRKVRTSLAMAGVPSSFMEYLRATAVLSHVDDDIDYYIRFNRDQNIQAHDSTYRKATTLEKEKHFNIEKLEAGIKKGSRVHLDIGPPNYVQTVVAELALDPTVKMALIKPATVIGFVNPYMAVIKYEDGSMFRVKKKLLTVPEKFHIDESRDAVNLKTAQIIQDKIATSVSDIHSRENAATDDWSIEVIFMCHGTPPSIEFKISSTVATDETIERLRDA